MEKWVNKVIQGDCLKVMAELPDRCVDLILCDLPYGKTKNPWDQCIDLDILWKQYKRVTASTGVIALTSQGTFTAKVILSNLQWYRYKFVWVKSRATNYLNAKKQPLRKHEDVCIFYDKQCNYNPQMSPGQPYERKRRQQLTGSYNAYTTISSTYSGERYPTDVIYFKTAESEGRAFHPNQKPVELGQYLIRTFTQPGAVVLDNACGSGSFLVAAIMEGRHFIGIEKNEEAYLHKTKPVDFIKICEQRISQAKKIRNYLITHKNEAYEK